MGPAPFRQVHKGATAQVLQEWQAVGARQLSQFVQLHFGHEARLFEIAAMHLEQ